MNTPQTWELGLLIFIFSCLMVTPCFSENVTTPEGTECIISGASWGTDQISPSIWGDRVVWTTSTPDPSDSSLFYFEIFVYNMTTGEEIRIPTSLGYSDMPDIWEDRIVFQSWEEDSLEINLYNLSTSEKFQLTRDMINQIKPRIWGDWIVWQEGDDWETDHGIYIFNIVTGNTNEIGSSASATSPDIWGDRVVWDEYRTGDGNFDIMLYNITSGNITQVTINPYAQTSPSIWGDRIVWIDNRDNASQIYLYNLNSETETRLTAGDFYREAPVISDDYVIYVNDTVVSLINLAPMDEFPISTDTDGSPINGLDMWGSRAVWSDMRQGDYDIYLFTIGVSMPDLDVNFTVNASQGEAPFPVTFNDSTSGVANGWYWDFGDGTSSDEQNPVHTYDSDGSFSVTLIVHNPWQRDAERKTNLISVGSVPVPNFTQHPRSGPAPLAVQFTDESSGEPVAWYWDFGDGEWSKGQNPGHVYQQPSLYTVNFTVENTFGNASIEKQDLITVMDGTFNTCHFPSEGITLEPESGGTRLTIDTSQAGNCTGDAPSNPSVITCIPDDGTGVASILFYSLDGERFLGPENGTFTGFLGNVKITSCDLTPLNFSQKAGNKSFFNFSLNPFHYDAGGSVNTVIWEGCTPDDFVSFNDIKIMYNYGNIEDLVYTVRFDKENLIATDPAILVFGVNSDWVDQYGWRWCHSIESNPPGAAVYVDNNLTGYTPICIEEGLSPGNHTVRLKRSGYYDHIFPVTIDDKRGSIHVIRIGDDGTGEVLNTTFIGHDPERNLDFFRAESPNGLSTFGLASLSKSGNIIQLVNLVISRVSGGGGGGGGGSSSSGMSSSAAASLASAQQTPAQTPALPEPGETRSSLQEEPPASEGISQPVDTAAPDAPDPAATSEAPGISPLGSLIEGTSSLIILRNLSVVFVVIFVTAVFFLRWKR